jgi:signal transduction histidine kinase
MKGFMGRMIIKFSAIFYFILLCHFTVSGQVGNLSIDSLKKLINDPVDTVRLEALKKITWELRFTDPLQGFEYAFEGLALADSLKRNKDMAILHNYVGVLATKISSFDKAKTHIIKAYQIADSLNFVTEKAYALNNLGEIYYQTGSNDSAISKLFEAIDIFKSINNLTGLAYAYNQTGIAMRTLKKNDEAVKYHKLSLEIREKLKHHYFAAKARLNIGIDFLEKPDYDQARKYFEEMDISQLDTVPYFSIPYRLILIGKTYQGGNENNTAIKYFKDALSEAQSMKLYPESRDAAKLLSDIYTSQGNHQTALFYFNKFKIWDDSLKNSNIVEKYKQLEMKRAFDQQYKFLEYKMQQDLENQRLKLYWNKLLNIIFIAFFIVLSIFIIILIRNYKTIAKQNKMLLMQKVDIETKNEELYTQNQQISEQKEELTEQRDALAQANATKDKFFSIIAHDLRGPVGNLTAFFDLMFENFQDKMDDKLKEFLNTVNSSVHQTYTLLENLLTWAQLQNGSIPFNPLQYSINSIIDSNINLLKSRAEEKSIKIINNLPQELVLVFDTQMIDTVIRNLLSNSIKFTFPKGVIKLTGTKDSKLFELSIEDSGVGMSNTEIERLFKIDVKHKSKEGTEGEKGTGLGLILCKEFIELHNGKLWVESAPGKGSTFKFTIPIKQ